MRKPSTTVLAVSAAAVGAVIATVVVLVVLNLGGDDKAGADAGSAAPTAGCSETTTEELYVQKAFTCPDGTKVLTFATTQARDDYLKVAEHFGQATVERGATWARVRV